MDRIDVRVKLTHRERETDPLVGHSDTEALETERCWWREDI